MTLVPFLHCDKSEVTILQFHTFWLCNVVIFPTVNQFEAVPYLSTIIRLKFSVNFYLTFGPQKRRVLTTCYDWVYMMCVICYTVCNSFSQKWWSNTYGCVVEHVKVCSEIKYTSSELNKQMDNYYPIKTWSTG